jgi:hypothetical protein
MANLHMSKTEREQFLAGQHIGVLGVARDGGRPPLTTPVWYGYEPGGDLTFFTGSQGQTSEKTELIRRAGVISFVVQDESFPYKYVTVEGNVVSIRPPTFDAMLAIVGRYLPEDQARGFVDGEINRPDSKLVLFVIRPERWLTTDYGKAS